MARPIPRRFRNGSHWPIAVPEIRCDLCGQRLIGLTHATLTALRVLIEDHRIDCGERLHNDADTASAEHPQFGRAGQEGRRDG